MQGSAGEPLTLAIAAVGQQFRHYLEQRWGKLAVVRANESEEPQVVWATCLNCPPEEAGLLAHGLEFRDLWS